MGGATSHNPQHKLFFLQRARFPWVHAQSPASFRPSSAYWPEFTADYLHPANAAILQRCQVSTLFFIVPSNCVLPQHAPTVRQVCYYNGSPRGSNKKCGVGSFSNFGPSPHHAHQSPRSRYGPNCESTHTACHSQ